MKKNLPVLLTGVIVGIAALVLTAFGNPANMGFCIACFLRDIAGALKLHSAGIVQYVRPEIVGIIAGAAGAALIKKEWKAVGGSSPFTRFVLAICVMIGALVFLGCPLRMVIRIGGGDLNAVVGLVGFIAGIFVGTIALKKGFSLKRNYAEPCIDGAWMPVLMVILLVLAGLAPALFAQSTEGPGSMHAPIILALAAGIVVGILAQRSRDDGRTPMQWDSSPNAGFTSGTPWIGVADNYKSINAAAQTSDADSIYSFYKAMVRLRKEHRVISEGKIEFLYPDNTDLLAYRRYGSADKEELLVLCNLTEQEIHAELPDAWATAEKLIGNYADNPSETLRPYECVVLHTTKE